MNKTMKFISIVRLISFVITVLTSIPLFVSHIKGVPPQFPLFTNLHTWFGLVFVIVAVISMIMQKKNNKMGMQRAKS